jgi:hypothetical protein
MPGHCLDVCAYNERPVISCYEETYWAGRLPFWEILIEVQAKATVTP